MELLNTVPSSGIPAFRATQEGYPKQEWLSHSNLPRDSVDPKGRRGKSRSGKRGTNSHEEDEHSETSSCPEDGSSSSHDSIPRKGNRMNGKSVPGLEEIIPSRSDNKKLVSYRTIPASGYEGERFGRERRQCVYGAGVRPVLRLPLPI
jgi:hypothetical protein